MQDSTQDRKLVLACATVMEEIIPILPPGVERKVFDFGLHVNPEHLRLSLQGAINSFKGRFETILLGYGMCAQAIVGLQANGCRLVVPKVDDCIGLFLGSRSTHIALTRENPGTYYLTKGWIEIGDTPFLDFDRNVKHYGREKAAIVYQRMMGNYTHLALINTGQSGKDKYRQMIRQVAKKFNLHYKELQGSDRLIRKLLLGPWDDEIIVIEPGEKFTIEHFLGE